MDNMVDFNNLDKTYFIGEIGINHNGDMLTTKKLIDAVHACGWDCAKFQKRSPEKCVPEHQKNVLRETPWGTMKYIDYKHKIEFGLEEYNYIQKYCKEKPLHWSASVWDLDSLEFLLKYELPFIKIPSAMTTNKDLVEEVARSGTPIIMSTGMCDLKEVDEAVNNVLRHNDNLVLMHTNSSYPTPKEELNLSLIPFLKDRYDCTVGYSGHEEDLEPTVIAAVLGAKVIERHITLSHNMWGTDQKSSLEILAMDMLYKRIQDIDLILGTPKKVVTKSEVSIRRKLRGE
jgi:N-acetylneuraminate synthase